MNTNPKALSAIKTKAICTRCRGAGYTMSTYGSKACEPCNTRGFIWIEQLYRLTDGCGYYVTSYDERLNMPMLGKRNAIRLNSIEADKLIERYPKFSKIKVKTG